MSQSFKEGNGGTIPHMCMCLQCILYRWERMKKEALKCHHSKNLFGKFCSLNLPHNVWDELTLHRRFNSNVQDFQSGAFQVPTQLG